MATVVVSFVATCHGGPPDHEPCGWSAAGPWLDVTKDGDRHTRSTGHAVGYEGRPARPDTPE